MEELAPGSANLDAAVQFVRGAGSPVGLARLDYLLTGSPPAPQVREGTATCRAAGRRGLAALLVSGI